MRLQCHFDDWELPRLRPEFRLLEVGVPQKFPRYIYLLSRLNTLRYVSSMSVGECSLNAPSMSHTAVLMSRNSNDLHEFRMSITSAPVTPLWRSQSFSNIDQFKNPSRFGRIPVSRTPNAGVCSPNWPMRCQGIA